MHKSIAVSNMHLKVELCILSRDRPNLCRETVTSALAQTYENLVVVLSDNSSTEDVVDMMMSDFPQVNVIRRRPNLSAVDHFNAILASASGDLLVIFHDDDVMAPAYVESMVALAIENPDMVAVACNAHYIYGSSTTTDKAMGSFSGRRRLTAAIDLIAPYLSVDLNDPAPFPGYMYRTGAIRGLAMDFSKGGKNCDVSFLCQVLERGPVLWTGECHFYYRIHASNDSGIEAVADRLSLVRFIQYRIGLHRRCSLLMDYRFMYWRRWLKQLPRSARSHARYAVVRHFVWAWGLRLALTRLQFWARSWRVFSRVNKR